MLSMFAIIFTIIVLFRFQTQLISNPNNPEHINHVPHAQIHGLNGDLPIQETGDMVHQHETTRIAEVLLVVIIESISAIVDAVD